MTVIRREIWGETDLEAAAIERIQHYEAKALQMHEDGYYVAFSGGKDSIVMLDLIRRAGVKHTAHFALTTVDPPELMQFVRRNYPGIDIIKPKKSMWQLIADNNLPPTRVVRYCCEDLKESGGYGCMVATGVRWEESARRARRSMIEACNKKRGRWFIHPIIEWTEAEVWQYIREHGMKYCCLYDEGWKRIGCIGCPMAGPNGQKRDFARWPRYEAAYRRACARAVEKDSCKWDTGSAMFEWWVSGGGDTREQDTSCPLFE